MPFVSFAAACDARGGVLIARHRILLFRLAVILYKDTPFIMPMKKLLY